MGESWGVGVRSRLDFELDQEVGLGAVPAHGGVPALIEHFRSSGASAAVVADLQARAPQGVATIDVDATILASSKRAARRCYDGRRGYQPVVALWAEQDAVVADEFRDGNVSAQSGNRRVIERALVALPEGEWTGSICAPTARSTTIP